MAKGKNNPVGNGRNSGNNASAKGGAKTPAAPSNALTAFGNNGNFGGAAYNNARASGLSVDQISQLAPSSGLKIGEAVNWILQNRNNFPSFEGGAGAPLEGRQVAADAYFAPGSFRAGFGPNANIGLMADPYGKTYAEGLQFMNDNYWNPSEEAKKRYYDNYQDDLSGGILKGTEFYNPTYGKYKAGDFGLDPFGNQAGSAFDPSTGRMTIGGTGAAAGASSAAAQQGPARTVADAKNLRQAIKIAAANGQGGLIDRRETNQIFDQFGDKKNLNDMKFAGILDKVNSNQTSKGKKSKQLIGMSGGALNLLNSGKLGPTGFLPYSTFGTTDKYGGLSGVLRNMGTTGKFGRTDNIYGQYSTGQFKDSPGLGKSWADTRFGKPMVSTGTTDGEVLPGGGTPGGDTAAGDTASPMTPEQMSAASTMGANQYGAGADLMSFANSWKPQKSSRKKAGKNAQGFAQQRTGPYNAYGISTNVG